LLSDLQFISTSVKVRINSPGGGDCYQICSLFQSAGAYSYEQADHDLLSLSADDNDHVSSSNQGALRPDLGKTGNSSSFLCL